MTKPLKTTPKQVGGVTGKGFQPGQSGNPGGRPKGLASYIRDQTKDGREIVDFWLMVLRGERPEGVPRKPTLRDQMQAASELTDRAFGRATQSMSLGMDEALPGLSFTIKIDGNDDSGHGSL